MTKKQEVSESRVATKRSEKMAKNPSKPGMAGQTKEIIPFGAKNTDAGFFEIREATFGIL